MVQKRLQNDKISKKEVAPWAASFDVVIPYVHSNDDGKELRAALATLYRIGDWSGKVWVCGDREKWFDDVDYIEYLPVPSLGDKFVNIQKALLAACNDERVSKNFYYSYDDCYIMRPFSHIQPLYREGWQDDGYYGNTVYATREWLRANSTWVPAVKVLNYEVHAPMPMNKANLKPALEICIEHAKGRVPLQIRTIYGNLYDIGGLPFEDKKEHDGKKPSGDIISTSQYREWLG